jgi:hypothetical protein
MGYYGIEFWAWTFDFAGKLLIAITALMAHRIIIKEKSIDDIVLKDLKLELISGFVGILFLITGYILHLVNLR